MKKPKVALALSGGAARGLAHIGVIKVLEKNNIPIDIITGTSMGSVIGAFYATNPNIKEIEKIALDTNNLKVFRLLDSSFNGGFIKGDKIEKFLLENLKNKSFNKLKIPLTIVASDLNSGESFYFNQGNIIKAIRASISIPLIFSPIPYKNKLLVDGYLSEPLPVKAAIKSGADIIIAVNLFSKKDSNKKVKELSMGNIAKKTTHIMLAHLSKYNAEMADVVITPNLGYNHFTDFSNPKKLIKDGEIAARKALPQIQKLILDFNK